MCICLKAVYIMRLLSRKLVFSHSSIPKASFSCVLYVSVSPLWAADCPPIALSYNGAHHLNFTCVVTASPVADVSVIWHYRNPAATDEFILKATTPIEKRPAHYNVETKQVGEEALALTLHLG